MMDEGRGVRVDGERLSVKEDGSGGELGSYMDLDPDPDPWKILWIRIRQNDADPLDPDPDPQHWFTLNSNNLKIRKPLYLKKKLRWNILTKTKSS